MNAYTQMYEIDAEKISDVERSEVSLKVIRKYKGKKFLSVLA